MVLSVRLARRARKVQKGRESLGENCKRFQVGASIMYCRFLDVIPSLSLFNYGSTLDIVFFASSTRYSPAITISERCGLVLELSFFHRVNFHIMIYRRPCCYSHSDPHLSRCWNLAQEVWEPDNPRGRVKVLPDPV